MEKRLDLEHEVCDRAHGHDADVYRARALLGLDAVYSDLAGLFGALSDPTRGKIVHMLLQQDLCTCDIAAVLGITDSAVSQHLKLLRLLRLVRSRRVGKFVYYTVDDAHISLIIQIGLTHLGHDDDAVSLPELIAVQEGP